MFDRERSTLDQDGQKVLRLSGTSLRRDFDYIPSGDQISSREMLEMGAEKGVVVERIHLYNVASFLNSIAFGFPDSMQLFGSSFGFPSLVVSHLLNPVLGSQIPNRPYRG